MTVKNRPNYVKNSGSYHLKAGTSHEKWNSVNENKGICSNREKYEFKIYLVSEVKKYGLYLCGRQGAQNTNHSGRM